MTPVLSSKNRSHFSGHCISFLCCVINFQKPNALKHCLLLFYSFYRSQLQAQHSWVLCSGSHESEIKMSAELHSPLELEFFPYTYSCYSKNSQTELKFLFSCCLSPEDLSQLLKTALTSYPHDSLIVQHLR